MSRSRPRRCPALPGRRARVAVAVTAAFAVTAGCAAVGPTTRTAPGDAPVALVEVVADAATGTGDDAALVAELDAVLAEVAAAFATGDVARLEPHLFPGTRIADRWRERVGNLAGVPLAGYALEVADGLGELATDAVRARHDGDATVRWVRESFRLDGFDDRDAQHDLFLTFFHTDAEGWRIVSDQDGEALGLVSADHLWDHGPVVTTGGPPLMAVHHPDAPDQATIDAVLAEAAGALATVGERWVLDWPGVVPIVVPRDQDELAELLHVTFSLDNFVAFASSTVAGDLGDFALTGTRIVVNPDRFLVRTPETREQILVHELLHVASRPATGPLVPSWLDEGIAQAVGEERSSTGTALVAAAFRDGEAGVLPTDADFTAPSRDRIFLSYQQAWSFVDHLVERFGVDAVAAFYREVGAGGVGRAGSARHRVDVAARDVFGEDLAALRASWAATGP